MTDLARLSVSLTKHGAHKLATLLKNAPADNLLKHLNGTIKNVQIDNVQAQKNLSAQNGVVPAVWTSVQAMGDEAIDSLVLLAIIFSHKKLIDAMAKSSTGSHVGTILRGGHLKGKEFTNFSHILEQLGFVVAQSSEKVSYDLSKLFAPKFGLLAEAIIGHKLVTAGWLKNNSVADEALALNLHRTLSSTEAGFRVWLKGEKEKPKNSPTNMMVEDEEFFTTASDVSIVSSFTFTPGHRPRPEGSVDVKSPTARITAELLHNKIQNNLYDFLKKRYGKDNVGTEVNTGDGTAIDVVLRHGEEFWFYEIKTALSVKATIRQALPQLLEYAYWPNTNKASRLIIVSHLPAKPITERYLKTLRERFGIPISYQHFCLNSNVLINNL